MHCLLSLSFPLKSLDMPHAWPLGACLGVDELMLNLSCLIGSGGLSGGQQFCLVKLAAVQLFSLFQACSPGCKRLSSAPRANLTLHLLENWQLAGSDFLLWLRWANPSGLSGSQGLKCHLSQEKVLFFFWWLSQAALINNFLHPGFQQGASLLHAVIRAAVVNWN